MSRAFGVYQLELYLTVSKLPALMAVPGTTGAVPVNGAAAVHAACSSNAVVANAALIVCGCTLRVHFGSSKVLSQLQKKSLFYRYAQVTFPPLAWLQHDAEHRTSSHSV
jgi:hypothetical protein